MYQAISAPTTCLSCYYTCYSHLPSRISVRGRYLHLAADFKQDQCTRALPKSCQLRSAYEDAIYVLATSKSFPVCTRAHLTQNLAVDSFDISSIRSTSRRFARHLVDSIGNSVVDNLANPHWRTQPVPLSHQSFFTSSDVRGLKT